MPRVNRIPIALTQDQRDTFWSRVNIVPATTHDDCWLWAGRVDDFGYGHFKVKRASLKAHRVAWTLQRGPIPDDKTLDHVCRNPRCVNPAHLALVSNRENILRGDSFSARNAKRTHCKRGHKLPSAGPDGRRECRECWRARRQEKSASADPVASSQHELSTREKGSSS